MGYKKWLLKHGLGSPGHTARAITKGFHYYLASNAIFDKSIDEEAYLAVLKQRSYILNIPDKLGQ